MLMVTDGKAEKSTRKQRKKEAQWSFVCREKATAPEVGTPMPSSLCLTKAVSYSYWVAPPCDSPSCLWVLKLLVTSDLLLPFAGSWCSQEPFIKGFSQGLDPPHKSTQIFLTCITVKTHHCLRNQTSEYSVFPHYQTKSKAAPFSFPLWSASTEFFSGPCAFVFNTLVSARGVKVIPIARVSVTSAPRESRNLRERRLGLFAVSSTFSILPEEPCICSELYPLPRKTGRDRFPGHLTEL